MAESRKIGGLSKLYNPNQTLSASDKLPPPEPKGTKRSIRIHFDGGNVSAIVGVELFQATDDRLGLCKTASRLLPDPRDRTAITLQWEA